MKRNSVMTILATLTLVLAMGTPHAHAQQAGISVTSSTVYGTATDTAWWFVAQGEPAFDVPGGYLNQAGNVVFNLKVEKLSSDNLVAVHGDLLATNTGSKTTKIGNVVVNLQKRDSSGKKWVSAGVRCANPFISQLVSQYDQDPSNDADPRKCNIVAASSQEDPKLNSTEGAKNYSVTGGVGTFVDSTDASGIRNGGFGFFVCAVSRCFDTVPILSFVGIEINPGATEHLIFTAHFKNSQMHIPEGASLRAEVLVSFTDAVARGGSGASAQNVDINGNGSIDSNESWVRTVPYRQGFTLATRDQDPLRIVNNEAAIYAGDGLPSGTPLATLSVGPFDQTYVGSVLNPGDLINPWPSIAIPATKSGDTVTFGSGGSQFQANKDLQYTITNCFQGKNLSGANLGSACSLIHGWGDWMLPEGCMFIFADGSDQTKQENVTGAICGDGLDVMFDDRTQPDSKYDPAVPAFVPDSSFVESEAEGGKQ